LQFAVIFHTTKVGHRRSVNVYSNHTVYSLTTTCHLKLQYSHI